MAKTRTSMVVQVLAVASKRRARQRWHAVQQLARFVKTMGTASYDVQKLIAEQEFIPAAVLLHDAEEALNGDMARQLLCLQSLKPQLRDMWPYLRRKMDQALKACITEGVVGSEGEGEWCLVWCVINHCFLYCCC